MVDGSVVLEVEGAGLFKPERLQQLTVSLFLAAI